MRKVRGARVGALVVALALVVPVFASPPPVAAETLGYFDIYASAAIDDGRGVAVDAAGNIYVVGETTGALPGCDPACTHAGNMDLFVRKYAADGTVAWTRELGSTAKDLPSEIALDDSGNVYVAGKVQFDQGAGALPGQTQVGTMSDGFLVKYSSGGALLWARQFGLSFASATEETDAYGLAVDGAGAAYVTGASFDVDYAGVSAYVRKYDATGTVLWEQRFAPINWEVEWDFAMPSDLALDSSGSVVAVSGQTYGTLVSGQSNLGGTDAFVATFAAGDGTPGWIRQWGTTQGDVALAVAIDSQGRIAVSSWAATSGVASSIRQLDSTGSLQWSASLATMADRPPGTTGRDIAIGPSDQIAVAGDATGVGTIYPAIWLFASDGTAGWSAMPADLSLYEGVAYGPGGFVYATGHYRTTQAALNDMILVRVGPTDTTAPTVSLTQAAGQADPAKVSPVNFSLVADEALDKTTVTAADFSITNGTIGTIACSGFLATTCTIPVTPTADGAVMIDPSGSFSVADPSGNAKTSVGGTDRTVTYDGTAPTVTLAQANGQADPASASPVNFSLVASEVLDEATVTSDDFTVTGGTLGTIGCTGAPTTCILAVNVTVDGTVTIAPSASFSVADLIGNTQTTAGGTDRTVVYAATVPANDNFANHTTLPGLSGSMEGTTVNGTIETDEPWGDWPSVWYEWTNTSRKDLVAVFTVSGCDTRVTAMTTAGPPWTDWDVITDGSPQIDCTTGVSMRFVATAGATYMIRAAVYSSGDPAPFTLSWSTESVIRGNLAITLTNTRGDPASCTLTVKGTSLLASQAFQVMSWDEQSESDWGRFNFTTDAGRWSPSTELVLDTYWSVDSPYLIKTAPDALLSADGASPVIPKVVNRCHL